MYVFDSVSLIPATLIRHLSFVQMMITYTKSNSHKDSAPVYTIGSSRSIIKCFYSYKCVELGILFQIRQTADDWVDLVL